MIILADIGEIGVHTDGKDYILRPSLYAMSRLAEPSDLIGMYAELMSEAFTEEQKKSQFALALTVIYVCAVDDEDVSPAFGYYEDKEYIPGMADEGDIIVIARSLMRHGITGALPPLPKKDGEEHEYVKVFSCRDHVSLAIAHLGVSERDAWNMTMTSLIGALRAKFPPMDKVPSTAKAPTKQELDVAMDWHDKVEAKRQAKLRKKQRVH
jgi:hypothetical protein